MVRPLWAGLPLSLAILSAELQKVFAGDLRSYFEYLRVRGIPQVAKVINDPIWRTIRVESWELAILDSPLIQRLRHIRQLGLAGLVYPSACHSRFEHTIGALYQTQRVIESINRNARAHGVRERLAVQEPVSRGDEVLLRIAAILHDVGHCFLSHLSERALNRLALNNGRISMQETVHDARDYFRSPKAPPVSELLSALIVLLPEFLDVLKLAEMPYWWDKETNLAFSIAKLVVGGRFPDRPFMNEIISGALDAD